MIRLLMIDDSRLDRELFKAAFQDYVEYPWLRDCDVEIKAKPFDTMAEYDAYDGVLVDLHLGAFNGFDVCKAIHLHDWRKPLALMTGAVPAAVPANALDHVDWVSLKTTDGAPACYDLLSVMRVMARHVADRKILLGEMGLVPQG